MDIDSGFVLELQHIVVAGLAAILVKILDLVEGRIKKWQGEDD